jgi:hypothetical protein
MVVHARPSYSTDTSYLLLGGWVDVLVGGFVDVFWLTIVMSVGLLQKSLEQRFSNERGRSYSVPPEEEKQRKERQD